MTESTASNNCGYLQLDLKEVVAKSKSSFDKYIFLRPFTNDIPANSSVQRVTAQHRWDFNFRSSWSAVKYEDMFSMKSILCNVVQDKTMGCRYKKCKIIEQHSQTELKLVW